MDILIADNHTLVREGLIALLEREPDMMVTGAAADGREAVALAQRLQPHLAVLDVAMPGEGGIEAAEKIRRLCPGVRLLAISAHDEAQYVRRMVDAGAGGYLLKDAAARELVQAVRAVAAGGRWFSAGLGYAETAPPGETGTVLSPREAEVVSLVCAGYRPSEIAVRFGLSTKTVETHRRNAMQKLQAGSMAELVKRALRAGLTAPAD